MAADSLRWRLAAGNGWGARLLPGDDGPPVTVIPRDVSLDAAIRLGARPDGPRSPHGSLPSLGQLVPPQNVTLHGDELLLASRRRRRILRFDRTAGRFRSWLGLEPLHLDESDATDLVLCRADDLLIVAERGRPEVVALHPATATVFDRRSLAGDFVVDISASGGREILILGRSPLGAAQVWCWEPGGRPPASRWRIPGLATGPAINPTRILRDTAGRFYLFDAATAKVAELSDPSRWIPLESIRSRFGPLGIVIEPHPGSDWRMRIPPAGTPLPYPWPAPAPWAAFDPDGRALQIETHSPVGPPPYFARGTVEIGPLEGRVPRVTWDRIELEFAQLPPGTAVSVRTRTAEAAARPRETDAPWSPSHRVIGGAGRERNPPVDLAILSPPGRFLWVELTLEGGASTPAVGAVKAIGPRGGMIEYLPLVFREMDLDTRFLERLVGALERSWEPLEHAVRNFDRELRPDTAGEPMLDYLASWFDEPLQPGWSVRAKRYAVQHGTGFLQSRGTPRAVQAALRLFLANRWNVPPESLGATPFLWEHFRSRRPLHPDVAPEGGAGQLFGSEVLHRLRLGNSAVGEGRLWEVGSPETDPVTLDAHRFTVFVPRALLPEEEDLRGFRNALAREQPVEASAEVVLIEPRFRVGLQATLGVDTLLGTVPAARLEAGVRLDQDTVLAEPSPGPRPGTPSLPWRIT